MCVCVCVTDIKVKVRQIMDTFINNSQEKFMFFLLMRHIHILAGLLYIERNI